MEEGIYPVIGIFYVFSYILDRSRGRNETGG